MITTFTLLIIYAGLGSLLGIVGIPWSVLRGNVRWMYKASMWIMRAGTRAVGIPIVVTGLENIPAGRTCIFMSNHVSNLDPPILMPVIPGQLSVILKHELMSIPILSTAMRMGQFVPVGRESSPAQAKASIDAAAQALRSGLHIMIFPEGSRSDDGRLLPFKKGPFYLAKETGAPVIPVAISGTEIMMRTGSIRVHRGTATVRMLPAIDSTAYATREELMAAVRGAINAALPPQMQSPQINPA